MRRTLVGLLALLAIATSIAIPAGTAFADPDELSIVAPGVVVDPGTGAPILAPGAHATFEAVGGTGPYVFTSCDAVLVVSPGGEVVASDLVIFPRTTCVNVTDDVGATASIAVLVFRPLADTFRAVVPEATVDLTALYSNRPSGAPWWTFAILDDQSGASITEGTIALASIPDPFAPSGGVTFVDVPTFTYTAGAADGLDTILVTDQSGATAIVAIKVGNRPPDASEDFAFTDEDLSIEIDSAANDFDPDGDDVTVLSVEGATHGTAVVVAGRIQFTPAPNVCSPVVATIDYTATDGHGGTSSSTVFVDIACENDPPVAVNDTASTTAGTPVDIDVLANDTDVDTPHTALSVTTSALQVTQVGITLRYTPPAGFCGTDTFEYTVSDASSGAVASVNVTVSCGTLAASAGGPYSADEGSTITLNATATGGTEPRTFAWDLDNNGTFETAGAAPTFTAPNGPATRTVKVRVTDALGKTSTARTTIAIFNVAPTGTFVAPSTVASGTPFAISLNSPVDAAPDLASLRYRFDCGSGAFGAASTAPTASCSGVTGPVTRTVRARIIDRDGGQSQYTSTIVVSAPLALALELTAVCPPPSRFMSVWRITNSGPTAVTVTYDVNGMRLPGLVAGRVTVPAHGTATFSTLRLTASDTARIRVDGVVIDTAEACRR